MVLPLFLECQLPPLLQVRGPLLLQFVGLALDLLVQVQLVTLHNLASIYVPPVSKFLDGKYDAKPTTDWASM
jgi:hypothetical protein